MYKYQKETIEEIKNCIDNLEKLTEKEYILEIGALRYGYNSLGETEWRPIKIILNRDEYFHEYDTEDIAIKYSYDDFDDDDHVVFDKNIFLKFNKLINKILKDEKEKQAFHEKLNRELEALNKSL